MGLSGKDPTEYRPHPLHQHPRIYRETNCYLDVLIELLHGHGYEPLAMLAHIVRMDFEGDQWTFFKPAPTDLEALYGVDVHEMNPYRPLPVQIAEQLGRGHTMTAELDAFHLPDATTVYRREHVKTTCAFDSIDPEAQTLTYFHAGGLFELSGEDYRGLFPSKARRGDALPPYIELVRFDRGPRLKEPELLASSRATLARELNHVPRDNPMRRFGEDLNARLPVLLEAPLSDFHAYAFATTRMFGSGFEALGSYAAWLTGDGPDPAADPIREVVETSKALTFRLARRRAFDPAALIGELELHWARSLAALGQIAAE